MKNADLLDLHQFPEFPRPQTGKFYTNISCLEKLRTNLLNLSLRQLFFCEWKAGSGLGLFPGRKVCYNGGAGENAETWPAGFLRLGGKLYGTKISGAGILRSGC